MPLASKSYWIEDGTSGANAALALAHVVPTVEEPWLQYLYIAASDGGDSWAWELCRPGGTQIFAGYGAVLIDFGIEGFALPGATGADIVLDVAAAGSAVTTRAFIVGVDRAVPGA